MTRTSAGYRPDGRSAPDRRRHGWDAPGGVLSLLAMRRIAFILIIAGVLLAACGTSAEKPIVAAADGNAPAAADFTIKLSNGGSFTLSKTLADRPVVLNFWASWCPPCRQEMPDLDKTSKAIPGVQFIGVAVNDTPANAMAYVNQIGVTYPIAIDTSGAVTDAYGIHVLPQTWIIATDGTVVRTIQGAVTQDQLTEYIRQDLGINPGS